jgi:SAM-dependent methyltransferase
VARVYDLVLGGKDNFAVDSQMYERLTEIAPELPPALRGNRDWLARVVRWLAHDAGIDQFLDCGSGLPTAENTHDVAQRVNPDATVVYVDNDPAVVAHGRALLEENDRTHFVAADVTRPHEVLEHPDLTRHLDLTRPVAVIHCPPFS